MEHNYKEKQIYLGESDMARIITETYDSVKFLRFGADGGYDAYFIDRNISNAEIPAHYHLMMSFDYWVKFRDDCLFMTEICADKINVYCAGRMGCIVEVFGMRSFQSHYYGR